MRVAGGRYRLLEEELNRYRAQAGVYVPPSDPPKSLAANELLNSAQYVPVPQCAAAPEGGFEATENPDLAMERLSGRMDVMNISFDLDGLRASDLAGLDGGIRMSLENDVRRVSREHDDQMKVTNEPRLTDVSIALAIIRCWCAA